jgi:hypothetical protein
VGHHGGQHRRIMKRTRRSGAGRRGVMTALWVALAVLVVAIEMTPPVPHLTFRSARDGAGTPVTTTAGYRQAEGATGNGVPGHWGPGNGGPGNPTPGHWGPGNGGSGNPTPGHWGPGNGGSGNGTPENGYGHGGGDHQPGGGPGPGETPPPSAAPAPPPTSSPAPPTPRPAPPTSSPAPPTPRPAPPTPRPAPPTPRPAPPTPRPAPPRSHAPARRRATSVRAPRATLTLTPSRSHWSVAPASPAPAARGQDAPTSPAPAATRRTYSTVTRAPAPSAARPALYHVAAKRVATTGRMTKPHPSDPRSSTTAANGGGSAAVLPRSPRALPQASVSSAEVVDDRTLTPLLALPAVVLLLPVLLLCVVGRPR